MFREMRRKNQALSVQECIQILNCETSGVLALSGDKNYPYAVPLSYVYDNNNHKLFFHCAPTGHKIDAIKRNQKASFCVINQDDVISEKYTSYFKSVIAFGVIRILNEQQEKKTAIEMLAVKYHPNGNALERQKAIDKDSKQLCMLELKIEHMTGKEAIELANKK